MEAFIQVMESTIAVRDPYTVVHQRQVTRIACAIGQELGLAEDRLRDLCIAGALHDLGKIAIPSGLLAKSGKLNPLEFALLKTHPQVAYNILKPIKLPGNAAEIILQHHERLDGSGYPRGLTGYEIFLEARILGVADVMEAMCSHRPYRASLGLTVTLEELTRNQGILYDAAVVEIGLKLYAPRPVGHRGGDLRLAPTAVTHPHYSALPADVAPAQPGSLPGGGYPWFGNLGAEYVPVSPRRVGRNSLMKGCCTKTHLITGHNPVHEPVMVGEVLVGLNCRSGRLYVDGTVGEGGHAAAILDRIGPEGELWGLDRDPNALKAAATRLAHHTSKFHLFQSSYAQLGELLEAARLPGVAGILLDLGLSSLQLQESQRGFSFSGDEPLDMRFNPEEPGPTAATLLNRALETELERIFREYGEEHRARRIARLVVQERRRRPFQTTRQLVKLLEQAQGPGGRRGRLHPATRVFQALRIAVNLELEELAAFLTHAPAWLEPGGRLVVIAYHSLEDRLVKQGMAAWERAGVMVRLTRKPLTPTAAEVQANPRARSAKLRIAEKMVH